MCMVGTESLSAGGSLGAGVILKARERDYLSSVFSLRPAGGDTFATKKSPSDTQSETLRQKNTSERHIDKSITARSPST